MKKYVIGRIIHLVIVLILVSMFSYMIIQAAPGDPIRNYIHAGMTEEEVEAVRIAYGLNGSIPEQYVNWLKHLLQGDFGTSIATKRPVAEMIIERLPATLLLMGTSMMIALFLAIPLGLWAGFKKDKLPDKVISTLTYIGISIPLFWFAMVVVVIFALRLRILPSGGIRTTNVHSTVDLLKHLILPSVVLSLNNLAIFTKYIRSNTISQLEEDYILTAESKGTGKIGILFRHVLKNCLLPIITLVGINIAGLVCGSFVIESIFSWPGIGRLAMEAVGSRDYPVIMGYTMFSCLILVTGNFVADLLYAVADPRIRQGMGEIDG